MAKRRGLPYPAAEARQKADDPEFQADEAAGISVGDRCEVQPGAKRGTVRYLLSPLWRMFIALPCKRAANAPESNAQAAGVAQD